MNFGEQCFVLCVGNASEYGTLAWREVASLTFDCARDAAAASIKAIGAARRGHKLIRKAAHPNGQYTQVRIGIVGRILVVHHEAL